MNVVNQAALASATIALFMHTWQCKKCDRVNFVLTTRLIIYLFVASSKPPKLSADPAFASVFDVSIP